MSRPVDLEREFYGELNGQIDKYLTINDGDRLGDGTRTVTQLTFSQP